MNKRKKQDKNDLSYRKINLNNLNENDEEIFEEKSLVISSPTLSASIEQLETLGQNVFNQIKKAFIKKNLSEAKTFITSFSSLIDTLRKARNDQVELEIKLGTLIEKSEAEEFVKILCSTFRMVLYQTIDEIIFDELGLVINAFRPDESIQKDLQEKYREILQKRFDNILSQVNEKFEELSAGSDGEIEEYEEQR